MGLSGKMGFERRSIWPGQVRGGISDFEDAMTEVWPELACCLHLRLLGELDSHSHDTGSLIEALLLINSCRVHPVSGQVLYTAYFLDRDLTVIACPSAIQLLVPGTKSEVMLPNRHCAGNGSDAFPGFFGWRPLCCGGFVGLVFLLLATCSFILPNTKHKIHQARE